MAAVDVAGNPSLRKMVEDNHPRRRDSVPTSAVNFMNIT
jgi:hypothetical protein